uniref:Uncharacterized protein n=1 Tax=Rhizophora mucronata TaxID=61149 RepID=A0A2P2R255_RHIMU
MIILFHSTDFFLILLFYFELDLPGYHL